MKWPRFLDFFKCDTGIGTYIKTPPIPQPKEGGRCISSTPPPPPPPPKSNPIGRLTPIQSINGAYHVEVYDEILKDFIIIDSTNSERYGIQIIKDYHEDQKLKKRETIYIF